MLRKKLIQRSMACVKFHLFELYTLQTTETEKTIKMIVYSYFRNTKSIYEIFGQYVHFVELTERGQNLKFRGNIVKYNENITNSFFRFYELNL